MFLRIIYKTIVLIALFWALSVLFIVRKVNLARKALIENEMTVFNELREDLFDYDGVKPHSAFRVWNMFPKVTNKISRNETFSILKYPDDPPGIDGKPVILKENLRMHIKELIRRGWQENAFNSFVSDLIPLNRTLVDSRESECKNKLFSKKIQPATVIICFYNEAWSTLLRTLHSVLNRSPEYLLDEVVLVDDASTKSHLHRKLEKYVKKFPKVKLIRNLDREGLIRSRIIGTKEAKAPIVVYLDSHCECMTGWLEPLLERVSEDPSKVVSPVIDSIHESNFEYIFQDLLRIGGFTWDLQFTWVSIPSTVEAERKHDTEPVKTPVISGGLFAINKKFFEKLGFYDEEFEIWGAENFELSFKTWMCGGSMEIIPCSHVGHVFRKTFPYENFGSNTKNYIRLAEVWLDDYAKYFYERIGKDANGKFGNVTQRKNLRRTLNCMSFKWYLENVYPQMIIPDDYVASGQISSQNYDNWCIDSSLKMFSMENVKLQPCHNRGGNQYWIYTKTGEIRRESLCLDYIMHRVLFYICRGNSPSQIWLYDQKTHKIKHMQTRKCLTARKEDDNYSVILQMCIDDAPSQWWAMDSYKSEKLSLGQL